jgi:tetratricopeptide (TPR) repeat protein
MTLYDIRAQYYPKYAVTALNNKGLDASNLIKDDPDKLYSIYQEVIAANKEQTRPGLVLLNMDATIKRFQDGKLTTDDVLKTYESSLSLLDSAPIKTDSDAEQRNNARADLENLFITSKVASCQDLLSLFTPRFEANPNDMDLVNNIVKMLAITEDCTDNDLFLKAVTAMYNNNPSASAAYYLYRLNASRNNIDEALKYIEEAIAYETSDAATDANYSFEAAAFCFKNGRLAKAYNYANNAVSLDAGMAGKAYFLMGQIWGATSCGGDEIEKRAHYWVAVDFLNKAKAADASLTEDANRAIGSYSIYFPETAEAFMYNVTDGQAYRVVCNGMSASTTVRTRK